MSSYSILNGATVILEVKTHCQLIFSKWEAKRKPLILRKIPKISPGAYIFQGPFSRGLYSEGLIYGGKFAYPNRFG